MGIFSSSDKQKNEKAGPTIISEGTYFIGGLSTNGIVHIDGKYEGVILQAELVTITQNGTFIGDIKSKNIVISGYMDGKIDCDNIQILDGAKVIAEIRHLDMSIEKDAQFEGKSIKKDSELRTEYHQVNNKLNSFINKTNKIGNTLEE